MESLRLLLVRAGQTARNRVHLRGLLGGSLLGGSLLSGSLFGGSLLVSSALLSGSLLGGSLLLSGVLLGGGGGLGFVSKVTRRLVSSRGRWRGERARSQSSVGWGVQKRVQALHERSLVARHAQALAVLAADERDKLFEVLHAKCCHRARGQDPLQVRTRYAYGRPNLYECTTAVPQG